MAHKSPDEQMHGPSAVAGRYRVEREIGRGGMAVVYQVLDTTTGKQLALKRLTLRANSEKQKNAAGLFEHEFHTLAQLAHPRVIEVYNYGKDDTGPYYTMELLDGGDLKGLSPMPWQRACSLLSDVCSALILLHSRRQVHRDLTTRNVRCTRDSKAKLIDFGAMVPMGPCKQTIGTPPFTAPEVVALQELDARTDLYSLGATLYYALTGRHAYPARTFLALRDVWRTKPRPPSTHAEDVPRELDNLVLSLISLDRMARPLNAAEVMERLSAVAGLEVDEQLLVSQAYLSTPSLVGREEHVLGARRHIIRALRANGSILVIEGDSGAGRSRMLDACVLEGKIAGATVLRADASDSRTGNWGAVRALASLLLDASPELALNAAEPHLAVLGHALPELVHRFEAKGARLPGALLQTSEGGLAEIYRSEPDRLAEVWGRGSSWRPPPPESQIGIELEKFDDPQELRPRVQGALRDWLFKVSSQHCLILAVDDFHRVDEPSAALLALLSDQVPDKMLMVVVTVETGAAATSPAAIRLLKEAGHSIELKGLDLQHTQKLLASVFGDAPNVGLLADRVQKISQGSPRAVMQLAQHLVDEGLIRYQAGVWTLPSRIDASALPSRLGDALKARVQKLSATALELGQALALSPEQSFEFEECVLLSGERNTGRLIQALDELVACEILATDGGYYALSQQGWVSVLTEQLDTQKETVLHLRLAEIFGHRDAEPFRAIQHLLSAGEEERALDVVLDHYEAGSERLRQRPRAFSEFVQSLPRGWLDTLESLLRICRRLDRPQRQIFNLQQFLVVLSSATVEANKSHLRDLLNRLFHASGLGFYHELGDSIDPQERLGRALELAQQRYDATPESQRTVAPPDAIRDLARMILVAIQVVAISYDYELAESLPSLEPFVPLSPALGIIEKNVRCTRQIHEGRFEQARQGNLEILERIAQPDRAGLDETYHKYTRLMITYSTGLIEASLGMKTALERAEELEPNQLFQINAWRIRMVYYLRQGDAPRAESCRKRLELLQIQNSPSEFFEGTQLVPELIVYSLSDDLIEVKRIIGGIQHMAERFESWVPVLQFAQGEYQRIRGDYESALAQLEKALGSTAAGRHAVWPYLAATYVNTLLAAGRVHEARQQGRSLLDAAERENLGIVRHLIARALALTDARLGEYANALKLAEAAIDEYSAGDMTGLTLGLVYETRARVAVFMGDQDSFKTYARLCGEQYKIGHNAALTAKHEKLIQEARQADLAVTEELKRAAELAYLSSDAALAMVSDAMGGHVRPEERAQYALEVLARHSNCSGGALYTMQKHGPVLAAQEGGHTISVDIDTMVKEYIAAEIDSRLDTTISGTDQEGFMGGASEGSYREGQKYHPVLLCHTTQQGFAITGVAILVPDPTRRFRFPSEVVTALSKALQDAGDVAGVFAAG